MLQIKGLKLKNFRSWVDLDLPIKEGVTLVSGKNGAGKSSIRYGLQYGFLGSIPKFTKGELLNIHIKDTSFKSEVIFKQGSDNFKIVRTDKTALLYVRKGDKWVKMPIRDLKILDKLKAVSSFIFLTPDLGQFIDMTPAKRKDFLASLLEEIYVVRNDAVKKIKNFRLGLEKKLSKFDMELYTYETTFNSLQNQKRNLKKLLEKEKQDYENFKLVSKAILPMTEEEFKQKKEKLERYKQKLNKLLAEIKKQGLLVDKVGKLEKVYGEYSLKIMNLNNSISVIKSSIVTNFNILQEKIFCKNCGSELVCKECGKVVYSNPQARVKAKREIKRLKKLLISRVKQKYSELEKGRKIVKELNQFPSIINLRQKLGELKKLKRDIEFKVEELNAQIAEYVELKERQRFVGEENEEEYKKRINELQKELRGLDRDSVKCVKRIKFLKKKVDILKEKQNLYSRGEFYCKETIPTLYFAKFLDKYVFCVQMILKVFGHKIKYLFDKENIVFLIDGKKFKMLSSGEKQRVRIATTLGFALMYSVSDFIMIDEVFDSALDEEGITVLAEIIDKIMLKKFKSIFLVTHRKELIKSISYKHLYLIIKRGDFSKVIIQ